MVRRSDCSLFFSRALTSSFVAEFQGLWRYIKEWQEVFRRFDGDHSGSIDGHELSYALNSFGYKLSPSLLSLIEQKYGECGPGHGTWREGVLILSPVASGPVAMGHGPAPGITFDRFVRACVVVKTLTEAFRS